MSLFTTHRTVIRESLDQTIARLEKFVAERRYECRSATMMENVAQGRMRETAEVGKWTVSYRVLKSLKSDS